MDIRHAVQTGSVEAAMERVNDLDPEVGRTRALHNVFALDDNTTYCSHILSRYSTRTRDSTFTFNNNASLSSFAIVTLALHSSLPRRNWHRAARRM